MHNCKYFECDKRFIHNGKNKRNHELQHMNNTLGHICPICKKSLSSYFSLKSHIETHKEMSERVLFDCKFCKSTFTSRYSRDTHQSKHNNVHLYEPPKDYHHVKKPKYIVYYHKSRRVSRCIGIYTTVEQMTIHLSRSRDEIMNIYLDSRKSGKLGKYLIIQKLEPVNYSELAILDKNISFD